MREHGMWMLNISAWTATGNPVGLSSAAFNKCVVWFFSPWRLFFYLSWEIQPKEQRNNSAQNHPREAGALFGITYRSIKWLLVSSSLYSKQYAGQTHQRVSTCPTATYNMGRASKPLSHELHKPLSLNQKEKTYLWLIKKHLLLPLTSSLEEKLTSGQMLRVSLFTIKSVLMGSTQELRL